MKISIIDYGTGNIKSIFRVFKKFEVSVDIVSKPEEIQKSTHLILPGVGAFPKAMELLNKKNLIAEIKNHTLKEKPLLGICLGMQLLFSSSDEITRTDGLNLIKGRVVKLPNSEIKDKRFKIPNVGWHNIKINKTSLDKSKYIGLSDLKFYFVHSFFCETENDKDNLFHIKFNKKKICVVAKKDNIMGTQFHPEKSGENGFKLIEIFLKI
jgi:glutamine amidotransferase